MNILNRVSVLIAALSIAICCIAVPTLAVGMEAEYTTTVNVYDISGDSLLFTYSASDSDSAPLLTFTVDSDGLTVSDSAGVHRWTSTDLHFAGFAIQPYGELKHPIGASFVGGDGQSDLFYNLYVFTDDESSWFERIWVAIVSLPELIDKALMPSAVYDILHIFDFSFVTDFFSAAYDGLTSLFGLSHLIDGDDNPFGWLTPPDSFIEDVGDV